MVVQNSSKLDTLETTGDLAPPESYRNYCLTKHRTEYEATESAYADYALDDGVDRLKALRECRTGAWFARNKLTGIVKVLSSACHLRWCPMCSSTRKWFLTQQVSEWQKGVRQLKFLTLTLAHSDVRLFHQVELLYESFRKFRKTKLLKNHVRGGVWFFQIHRSDRDGLWHPHLHCVLDSPWIDKYKLSANWEHCTRGSKIINIKEVKNPDKMAEYVARYAARPSLLTKLDVPGRFELLQTLHGRRLVGTWGNARSIVLRPSKPPDADDWQNIGSFGTVMLFLNEDYRAREIWNCFKLNRPCPVDCNLQDLECELDDYTRYEHVNSVEPVNWLFNFY